MNQNEKEWFSYFKTGQVSENAPDYVLEACEKASYQNLQEEEKDVISARERAEQDALAREDYVWTQGMEQGRTLGMEQGRMFGVEILNQMSAKGKSIQEIGELTGLNEADIRNLIR
jgi:hypothetical protein